MTSDDLLSQSDEPGWLLWGEASAILEDNLAFSG